jgi:hypothetical protein
VNVAFFYVLMYNNLTDEVNIGPFLLSIFKTIVVMIVISQLAGANCTVARDSSRNGGQTAWISILPTHSLQISSLLPAPRQIRSISSQIGHPAE